MATITATGSSHHGTLTANTVEVVTLDRPYRLVQVVNHDGTAVIYATSDRGPLNQQAVTPTVAGDGTTYVAPNEGSVTFTDPSLKQSPSTVRLISSSAANYTVAGF